ncbi:MULTISPECIES: CPBP family intramembrane glutamic endopeptidase [unclassified Crossiella]|uniref:CPBP family intramembrane glutamic endopeptidase n=1 Tax=unclassified Crossiella TaxID=2620835 RepID=UPI001FFE8410|nr:MULTISPECIES: CPBP family intramembrane glutamic endopeptidase [unclassified Crossiella]MCK2236622.1 CPBP family intramembrane metalloprotease [Crossiella sp. S99.2]MCK2250290.1 CPBP family intramembrane metalloprotease [Crossiella sp. S99.1]
MTTTADAVEPGVGRSRRNYLAAEFLLLFFGAVTIYTVFRIPGGPIPLLVVLGVVAVVYLRRQPDFDRANFWRARALWPVLPRMLLLWGATAVLGLVSLWLFSPERLFELPRNNPTVWLFVMLFYPLLSVYPQELIFRAFLFHRYAPVFGNGLGMVAASAAAFGFVHIIFGNVLSVVLTVIGGWIFSNRYRRTRSLFAAWVEHGLYGLLVFTIGFGDFFYHGAAVR